MTSILEYILIVVVAFGASLITFISGFGLGTILMPGAVRWGSRY